MTGLKSKPRIRVLCGRHREASERIEASERTFWQECGE